MIIDGFVYQLPDLDPEETQEWLDALAQVVDVQGKARARFLMSRSTLGFIMAALMVGRKPQRIDT